MCKLNKESVPLILVMLYEAKKLNSWFSSFRGSASECLDSLPCEAHSWCSASLVTLRVSATHVTLRGRAS